MICISSVAGGVARKARYATEDKKVARKQPFIPYMPYLKIV